MSKIRHSERQLQPLVFKGILAVGPQRLKAIWQAFGSLEELAGAEATDIADRAKLPMEVAERVRERAREVGERG